MNEQDLGKASGPVVVLMPTVKDGERTRRVLERAGIAAQIVKDEAALCAALGPHSGAVLLTEEALHGARAPLIAALDAQPTWSTLPVVVLSREGADRDALPDQLSHATLVERPVRVRTLVSVIRAALRSRVQQYEIRDALAERERQTLALAEQGEHLYFALTAGRLGSWALSLPDRTLETSELTRTIFGRLATVPMSYGDLMAAVHPVDAARFSAALAEAATGGGDLDVEVRVRWADGQVRWVMMRGRSQGEGAQHRLTGVLLDVTALRKSERALAEARDLYRTLVEQVRDHAIFNTGIDGRATTWNVGVGRVLGYTEAEFVGLPVEMLFMPEDRAEGVHARELEEAAREGSASNDRWMCRKGGRRFFAMGTTTALRDGAGKLLGFCKVMRDQTEWRHDQEALARTAQALRDADHRKDRFLATLAHELRNPLAPIRTGLQVLALDPQHAGSKRAKAIMERQLAHMVHLIDDLLDVSRITRGKVELKRERLALSAIIDAAVEGSRPAVDAARHELTVHKPAGAAWVDGDPTRLTQVLSNLINNAAKYTPRGGHIVIRGRVEGGDAVVDVTDDGLGIPPDQLTAVFEMFSQVNHTLDRAQGGLGIGLALVAQLVEMHGGSVVATSGGLGRGSTFTVRLPIASAPALDDVALVGRPSLPPPSPSPRRVLVVDDNIDGAETLADLLGGFGHSTRVVHDGPEALAAIAREAPEVVFLDIGLPGMSGYEVARQLRASGCRAVLVALTGWGSAADKQAAMAAGFDFHLTKPVEPSLVSSLVARSRAAPPS